MAESKTSGLRQESFKRKLEDIHVLLDKGQSSDALIKLSQIIKSAQLNPSLLANAKCAYSVALEMQGKYQDSLSSISIYETIESRAKLDVSTRVKTLRHTALAYNYAGNHPKAIALLNLASREASENNLDDELGNVFVAFARVYRNINEYTIARDFAEKALEKFRNSGDWRGLSDAWFALGATNFFEGNHESCLTNMKQALSLIGKRPANYQLGKIYNNMAAACWFLRKPQEGIGYLEKAVEYFELTEHKANAMDGYNNLGINLILAGEWDRAQAALDRALEFASQNETRPAIVATFLDSHGELQMLRGNLREARKLLEEAVNVANTAGNKWYESQAHRTLSKCHLAMGETETALSEARKALELGEKIGDRQAICEAKLLISEAHLQMNDFDACAEELKVITEETKDSPTDLAIAGNTQRLLGMMALQQDDCTQASNHFGRAISIYEMLGDVYRCARAQYFQGCAYSHSQPERARTYLLQSITTFQKLGAKLALSEAETALSNINSAPEISVAEIAALIQSLTMRLSEATSSRELLLRELAAVISEETPAQRLLIVEVEAHRTLHTIVNIGWNESDAEQLCQEFSNNNLPENDFAARKNISLIHLKPSRATPATLIISPQDSAVLPRGLSLDSLLRVVELGLNNCALHNKTNEPAAQQEPAVATEQNSIPGFIHSSPAMTKLVDEINKIRSSDVTALVTGESGTGKELVARSIHAISSRRSKVFVPFNCTAVPKELSDAFLFGYRKGSFTGAVADSAGVIRAAEGGTLFLDEVGDLPLDIQPKLLRFLQEGEIQPLGEHRPMKVDVRVIAATNSDLEEMVAAGRFREDLYYRLNVIRLQVPPLRERRSEVAAIANYYLAYYAAKFGRQNISISPQTLDLLMVYDWPGNVRQLTNEIQRIVARSDDNFVILPEHLSHDIVRSGSAMTTSTQPMMDPLSSQFWQGLSLTEAVDRFKSNLVLTTLKKNRGNVSSTARELGMTRRGIQLIISRYDLEFRN